MKTMIRSMFFAMALIAAFTMGAQAQSSQGVNGKNVTFIKFGNSSSSFLGTYVMRGPAGQWEEEGQQQGVAKFTFKEKGRDDWSVYLRDESRAVDIQIDLHTGKVMYRDRNNREYRELFNITERYSGPNGWTCIGLKFGQNGAPLGHFRKQSGNNWTEEGKREGDVRFNFVETGRDEWSVYLRDNSRGVNIQLDLHRKKVIYSDNSNPTPRDLYDIMTTR